MSLELQVELEQIARAQEKLQKRLDSVLNAIKAIEVLAQESDEPIIEPHPLSADDEQGFTDQVRAILIANPIRAFTAVDIRNVILERLDSDDEYADPKIMLIHTHNTLKRLFRQDEVIQVPMNDGRTGYKWKKNLAPVVDLMAALKESLAKMEKTTPPPTQRRVFVRGPTMKDALAKTIENERKKKEEN
jgi:hypothetical protein